MGTYRLTVSYNGRHFKGWQRHPGQPTVQGALEDALFETTGVRAAFEGAGRTDAGAHADAQVASVRLADTDALGSEVLGLFNEALPEGIRVLDLAEVAHEFHARKDAIGKTYRYVIWNAHECPKDEVGRVWHVPGKLDVDAMRAACPYFVGELDFATFAKKPNFERATTVRHMHSVELEHTAPRVTVTMRADSFLYKMVRNVMRAIVKVGEGRADPSSIPALIAARDRKAAPGTAPASGLHLEAVHYDMSVGVTSKQPAPAHAEQEQS